MKKFFGLFELGKQNEDSPAQTEKPLLRNTDLLCREIYDVINEAMRLKIPGAMYTGWGLEANVGMILIEAREDGCGEASVPCSARVTDKETEFVIAQGGSKFLFDPNVDRNYVWASNPDSPEFAYVLAQLQSLKKGCAEAKARNEEEEARKMRDMRERYASAIS